MSGRGTVVFTADSAAPKVSEWSSKMTQTVLRTMLRSLCKHIHVFRFWMSNMFTSRHEKYIWFKCPTSVTQRRQSTSHPTDYFVATVPNVHNTVLPVCSSPWIHTGFVGGLELLQGGALLQQEVGGLPDDVLFCLALAGTRNLTQAAEGVGEVGACRRANT